MVIDKNKRNVVYLNREKSLAIIEDNNNDFLVVSRLDFNEEYLNFDIVEYFTKSFDKAMDIATKISNGYIFDNFY